ncbi:CDP-glycerol glycerophosphotransferase family protein [Arthrobacter gengyunqii]|uniref:CDP-glycerol glycerophosphotransferase family protein n=1 Tax=Arthrobacter gengyunqii TaxID=2886940 RepID=A0A9X1LYS4_9MICC|nr:glycosyltransferase [Arthrobacter gengyunqii]MCC3267752.1 CDP-glycerol glycerophosphotransferase family protein [Arthrobacter gengyunqii]UOY95185.1 CDP-glycerol glycerophosphotransferase family protein [Arthrobacter gengyunqii]
MSGPGGKGQALFSIVSAVYNAEAYLDAFLESLEQQRYPFARLDIILVDDGSTDSSLARMEAWQRKYPQQIRILTGANGGPGAARNRGLDLARNPWITFCDPDDVLDPGYLDRVAGFIRRDRRGTAAAVTGRLIQFFEDTGELRDTHALAWKFLSGERIVDLNREPHYVHLSAGTVFLRKAVLDTAGLRFDERIRPTFEDAHLVVRYLNSCPRPTIGLVPDARYYYRQRAAGTSLAQSGWASDHRYTSVLDHGYLALLQALAEEHGSAPRWAQNTVLYDVMWYFLADRAMRHPVAGLTPAQRGDFLQRLERIFSFIDTEAILDFALVPVSIDIRTAVALRFKGNAPAVWYVDSPSPQSSVRRYAYFYRGDAPAEQYLDPAGSPLTPATAKRITHEFFGEVFAWQRVVHFPAAEEPRCDLDGSTLETRSRPGPPQARYLPKDTSADLRLDIALPERTALRAARLIPAAGLRRRVQSRVRRAFHPGAGTSAGPTPDLGRFGITPVSPPEEGQAAADEQLKLRAATPEVRARYQDAWLVMDRPDHGFDNGEHFYRYLARHQPDINAWFVLKSDSPDWSRLQDEGFRLVPWGSDELVLLALNAKYRISSDAALPSYFPIDRRRFGGGAGRFVFLQHGVIWNDLSRWLNDKRLDRFITSTPAEYASLTADGSVYTVTEREVRLTGLARFDALHQRAEQLERQGSAPTTITVMPTWRMNVAEDMSRAATAAERRAILLDSAFYRQWMAFISDPRLLALLRRTGFRLAFFVHPSLAAELTGDALPGHVELYPRPGVSLHDLVLESAAFVTDYSSTAFDAAYIDRNVLYFQFDAATFLRGDHPARPGYFDYRRDGFGPVAGSVDELLENLEALERNGFAGSPVYTGRAAGTFAYRDAGNCARIFESVLELEKD